MLKAGLMCGEALSEQGMWGTQTLQIKERERMKTGPGLFLQVLFLEELFGWCSYAWCMCMVVGGVRGSHIQCECVRGSLFMDTECEVGIG